MYKIKIRFKNGRERGDKYHFLKEAKIFKKLWDKSESIEKVEIIELNQIS